MQLQQDIHTVVEKMHINELYQNKRIGILNIESIVGKMLFKKLVAELGGSLSKIFIMASGEKNEGAGGTNSHRLLAQDSFFKNIDFSGVRDKIVFVNLNLSQEKREKTGQKESQIEKIQIDILFNCHIPQDFTRNTVDAFLNSHVWKSKNISFYLKQCCKIGKIILLSSLYSQNYGYVSQSDGQINLQPLGYSSQEMNSPQLLKESLKDVFQNDFQIWQWSLLFSENIFALESGTQQIEVVRVPLIGPSLENYQGYTSAFSTLTSLIYELGKKKIDALQGNVNNIIDIIPADFVSNYLIVIPVKTLGQQQKYSKVISGQQKSFSNNNEISQKENKSYQILIHNLSSSSRNPISLSKFSNYIGQAWIQYSGEDYKPTNIKIHEKKWERKAYSIQQQLPNKIKSRIAYLFDFKSWKIEAQQHAITTNKKLQTIRKYRFFLQHEWICQSNKSIDYHFSLSSEDQARFNFNVNTINWKTYAKLCCYSISKYLLGVHVQKFNPSTLDLLSMQKSTYFSDIFWALTEGKPVISQDSIQIKNYILSTKSVKEAIQQLVQQKSKKLEQTPTAYEKVEEQFYKIADEMCTQMFSQYSMNSIRGFAWFLHKVFRAIYEKVVVDKNAIMKLRNHDEKNNGPLIIIPTHRSYIDFLIMSYVFFGYGIKVPHIAAAEDFLNMAIIHILLRKSGAFFIKRDQKRYRNLYKAIMSEYITKLLVESHYLQFFIEGTRSRVGKMLQPKYGILSIVARNVLDGKIPDAQILPVTVNYEKILEGTSYTYQLMGQAKVKQSLSRLIKAVDVLKQNYGRIYIELCQPISVKKYFSMNMPKYINEPSTQYERTLNDLGYKIVHQLSNSLVITSPAIVSSIILMYRIGISDDKLSEKVQWLSKQITSRGIKVARTQSDSSISVSNTLSLMGDILNKSKKDMFQVQVSFDQNSFIQLFKLTYYRNTLTHIFFQEALIAVAMASFGHQQMTSCRIRVQDLQASTMFLASIMKRQYVIQSYLSDNPGKFHKLLGQMIQKKVIEKREINNEIYLGITNSDQNIFVLYCSLIWPLIESYWICILYFFKLIKDNFDIQMPKLQSQIQWFGQSIFTQRIILHLEAISMDTIKNATATFKSMKIIGESKQASKGGIKVLVEESKLKGLQKRLQVYLKSKYANTLKGSIGNGRGSVSLDFPFLSKL